MNFGPRYMHNYKGKRFGEQCVVISVQFPTIMTLVYTCMITSILLLDCVDR